MTKSIKPPNKNNVVSPSTLPPYSMKQKKDIMLTSIVRAISITLKTWLLVPLRWMPVFWSLPPLTVLCHKLNNTSSCVDKLVLVKSSFSWTRWIWSKILKWLIWLKNNWKNFWKNTNMIQARLFSLEALLFHQFKILTQKSVRAKLSNFLTLWTN